MPTLTTVFREYLDKNNVVSLAESYDGSNVQKLVGLLKQLALKGVPWA